MWQALTHSPKVLKNTFLMFNTFYFSLLQLRHRSVPWPVTVTKFINVAAIISVGRNLRLFLLKF